MIAGFVVYALPKQYESTVLVKIGTIKNNRITHPQDTIKILKDPIVRAALSKTIEAETLKDINDKDISLLAISDAFLQIKTWGLSPI